LVAAVFIAPVEGSTDHKPPHATLGFRVLAEADDNIPFVLRNAPDGTPPEVTTVS
jgi:hypothetical protein